MANFVYDAQLAPQDFIGRSEAVKLVSDRLSHAEVLSSSVVGGPKAGKSSFARYLASSQTTALMPQIPDSNRVYVDAQALSVAATSFDFWRAVLRPLDSKDSPAVGEAIKRAVDGKLEVFDLEDVSDGFGKLAQPVVLFVDNFESLLNNANFRPPNDFFHVIRSLGQRHPRGIAFVLTTPRPLLDLWDPDWKASPYYNIFVTVPLGPLTDGEVRAFVKAKMAAAVFQEDSAIEQVVLSASYGHPYLASFVTSLCIEALIAARTPDPAEIGRALRDPEGPAASLSLQVRAVLTASERQLLNIVKSSTQSVTARQKETLRGLHKYALLPPGIEV
jgi:hypothetical protein